MPVVADLFMFASSSSTPSCLKCNGNLNAMKLIMGQQNGDAVLNLIYQLLEYNDFFFLSFLYLSSLSQAKFL